MARCPRCSTSTMVLVCDLWHVTCPARAVDHVEKKKKKKEEKKKKDNNKQTSKENENGKKACAMSPECNR